MARKGKVTDAELLRAIAQAEVEMITGMSMKKLGLVFGVTHQAISERVRKLRDQGLVLSTSHGVVLSYDERMRQARLEAIRHV